MDKGKKRERNVNYSIEDTERLVTLVLKYKYIIENKKSDAATWQAKERAWKAVEIEYNHSGTGIFRDAKHLKSKYEALKRDTRKKFKAQGELYETGGGINLTPVEEQIKKMILLSVEGGDNTCDSDQLDNDSTDPETLIVIPECEYPEDNSAVPMTGCATDDDLRFNTNIFQENAPDMRHLDHVDNPGTSYSSQMDTEATEPPLKKWTGWKPSNLKSKKHPEMCKPRAKRAFYKLADAKLEVVQLQKTLIEEEIQEKKIKKQMMTMELQYKKELYELEKEERLLKISFLRSELEKTNPANNELDSQTKGSVPSHAIKLGKCFLES